MKYTIPILVSCCLFMPALGFVQYSLQPLHHYNPFKEQSSCIQELAICRSPMWEVPEEWGSACWLEQFETTQDIDCEITRLQCRVDRLAFRSRMDWLNAQRFLTQDTVDYHFLMWRANAERIAVERLLEIIELLQARRSEIED